jgi:pre-60S factor REI1
LQDGGASLTKVWIDPLSKKKFYSENTYLAYTRSKKYADLVKRKSGGVAPEAVVRVFKENKDGEEQQPGPSSQSKIDNVSSHTVKRLSQGRMVYSQQGDEEGSEDEWETASDESEDEEMQQFQDPSTWEKWDLNRSLFDNHMSSSMAENLEYMWKTYGFYLPDSKYLKDPEGLLRYLGAKLQYGKLPLYESGLNPEARRLKSLHGVQRHMVDRGRCKILYDGNEEEYEDYYDYSLGIDEEKNGVAGAIVSLNVDDVPAWFQAAAGYELAIPSKDGPGVKILGSREFARYYKQRHKPADNRASTAAALVVNKYNQLTVPIFGDGTVEGMRLAEQKRVLKCKQRVERVRLMASLRRNVNDNLPKNVPY